jgi:GNAT superfamily N-acetyltransferase
MSRSGWPAPPTSTPSSAPTGRCPRSFAPGSAAAWTKAIFFSSASFPFAERAALYGWIAPGRMEVSSRRLVPLPAGTAFSYKVFTRPSLRGKGLMPAYYSFLARELKGRGMSRLLACVESRNTASLRAHFKVGLREVGSYRLTYVLGRPVESVTARRAAGWSRI